MSKQTKEQFQKAANGLTDFLEAFEQLKQEEVGSGIQKEIIPLLSEIIQEDHQDLIPDMECLLRIAMNQENYYSYSLAQAFRRLKTSELQMLNQYALEVTSGIRKYNSEEVFELDGKNNRVHKVNSTIIGEFGQRLHEVNKTANP